MDKKQIIILAVAIITSLIIGISFGISLQKQNKTQVAKTQAVSGLSSKTVSSITVYGKVTDIKNKTLTVNNLGDNLSISMKDNALVYSTSRKQISLDQVKIGDNINVSVGLLSSGQIEGHSIIVLP